MPVKDNFELIAFNTALIHRSLKRNYMARFPDEGSLVVTAGIIDAFNYIQENSISIKKIRQAYLLAKQGECSLDLVRYKHEQPLMFSENILRNFIMQIECMMFYADNETIARDDIVASVIHRREDIDKMVKMVSDISDEEMEAMIKTEFIALQFVDKFMASNDFKDMRTQAGLKD